MTSTDAGLAFDLSKRNTGVALFVGAEPVSYLEWSFLGCDYFGEVLASFGDKLRILLAALSPAWIAYEEVRPVNKYHSEQHFGMVGVLSTLAWRAQIPLLGVNTGSMRKTVLGYGRATKDEAVQHVQRTFPGLGEVSHDVAEAVVVGLWFLSTQEGQYTGEPSESTGVAATPTPSESTGDGMTPTPGESTPTLGAPGTDAPK